MATRCARDKHRTIAQLAFLDVRGSIYDGQADDVRKTRKLGIHGTKCYKPYIGRGIFLVRRLVTSTSPFRPHSLQRVHGIQADG